MSTKTKITPEQEEDLKKAKNIIAKYENNKQMQAVVAKAKEVVDKIEGKTPKSKKTPDQECPTIIVKALESVEKAVKAAKSKGDIDPKQLENLIENAIKGIKIGIGNLDEELMRLIQSTRNVTITQLGKPDIEMSGDRPEIFNMAYSDLQSKNNVYMFGSAGTGKTFTAEALSAALDCTLITINCNQYTSPLEIIGGQTIDGYQEGKLIVAWANLVTDPERGVIGGMESNKQGCLLLLDELPKLDPNTAGLLNDALSKIKNADPKITNARGEVYHKRNFYVVATGNAPLNRDEPDYVANFKQDLSLQDRFMGSIYELFVNVEMEARLMKGYNFIFNYMNKLRNVIDSKESENKSIPSFGFVSLRIMQSMMDTWRWWHQNHQQFPESKTLLDSIESFYTVFLPEQAEWLKQRTSYQDFVAEIAVMEAKPLKEVTAAQETQTKQIVADYLKAVKNRAKKAAK